MKTWTAACLAVVFGCGALACNDEDAKKDGTASGADGGMEGSGDGGTGGGRDDATEGEAMHGDGGGTAEEASDGGTESAPDLPEGDGRYVRASGTVEGEAIEFECEGGEGVPTQWFWENINLTLYQLRCRNEGGSAQLYLDINQNEPGTYEFTEGLGAAGVGLTGGSQPFEARNADSDNDVVKAELNTVTITTFVPDERIEGSFTATWSGDHEAEVSGVFRITP